jgi:hypothetical protein
VRATNGRWDNALLYTQRSRLYVVLRLIISDRCIQHTIHSGRVEPVTRDCESWTSVGAKVRSTFRQYVPTVNFRGEGESGHGCPMVQPQPSVLTLPAACVPRDSSSPAVLRQGCLQRGLASTLGRRACRGGKLRTSISNSSNIGARGEALFPTRCGYVSF